MSLADRLRRETRSEHEAIEAALALDGDLTGARYRRVLERFYGFYLPLERELAALGVSERAKTPLLHADLEALGIDPAAVPLCAEIPRPRTQPEALGVRYVLEGATLGGQIISRRVQSALAITPQRGGRFFHGYGDRTGELWQAFRSTLAGSSLGPADEDSAVRSAIETFARLRAWWEKTERE